MEHPTSGNDQIIARIHNSAAVIKPAANKKSNHFEKTLELVIAEGSTGMHYDIKQDLRNYTTREGLHRKCKELNPSGPRAYISIDIFLNQIPIGSDVILARGRTKALYVATIGEAFFDTDPKWDGHFHRRTLTNFQPIPSNLSFHDCGISAIKSRPDMGWLTQNNEDFIPGELILANFWTRRTTDKLKLKLTETDMSNSLDESEWPEWAISRETEETDNDIEIEVEEVIINGDPHLLHRESMELYSCDKHHDYIGMVAELVLEDVCLHGKHYLLDRESKLVYSCDDESEYPQPIGKVVKETRVTHTYPWRLVLN